VQRVGFWALSCRQDADALGTVISPGPEKQSDAFHRDSCDGCVTIIASSARARDEILSSLISLFRFFDRSTTPVKAFTRGLGLAVVTLAMLAVAGCGPDNDTEANKLAKTAGDPGAPNPKAVNPTTETQVTTQQDFFKASQKNQQSNMPGYPGVKKK
jgi:hypothetical protein